MNLGLSGKGALVTAASQGLGRACAEALAREGANVVICSRHEEAIGWTAKEIAANTGSEVTGITCDLGKPTDIDALVSEARRCLGQIDILVFNHGNPPPGSFASIDTEKWQQGLRLSFWPALQLCHALIPQMKENRHGRIVFISSIFAKEPDPSYVISSTIRAGLVGLVKCLARELAPFSITANTVLSGYFDTSLLEECARNEARKSGQDSAQILRQWTEMIPVKSLAKPCLLGNLVVWLCSMVASNVTGTSIPCDGGLMRTAF